MPIVKVKLWTDTVHGFVAKCKSKEMAWQLIRNAAQSAGKSVPTIDKIIEKK